ncbi:c-type cytochrome [uncultured Shewanella sp.]|uniref:c-type cytochrome n=1 Tax=uncultured Shewanella sp. TaxID=173975 RepID=UPI00262C55FE|nr:c-type cytochrome [uncultured Shewanella sp.]
MVKKLLLSYCALVHLYAPSYAASSDSLKLITQVREHAHYSCAECHAIDGNPPITDQYNKQSPTLAGQDMDYLIRQLLAFKAGERQTDEMKGIMQDYSRSEIKKIAQYFSKQPLKIASNLNPTIDTLIHTQKEDAIWVEKGKKLYQEGDIKRNIASCQSCHGIKGEGNKIKHAPQLTAQHARYVRMALHEYQQGKRTTDKAFGSPMQLITKKLSNDDIKELAAYIQSMTPSSP